ncbi:facilitated trehalose transporter Tret1-2 homolog isoform X2 [Anabrus simplex]
MGEEPHQDTPATRRRAILIQLLVGLVANFASLAPGMSLGFSAVALPQMKSPNSFPQISESEESWIASLAAIATPFGCLLSGPLLDRFGRKTSLLALNVPCVIGWILLGCAPHSEEGFLAQVYAGRILTGIGTGMASIPATVYLAEIAHSSLRGLLVTWTSVFISIGILTVYILGSCLQENWRLVAFICSGFPMVAAVLVLFLPESPVWLLSNGRFQDAEKSFRRLRGVPSQYKTPVYIHEEIDTITANIAQQNARRQHTSWVANFRKSFFQQQTIKPLLIMNTYFFFQQFSGIFVVIFYAVDIVKEAGVTLNVYLATVLIGVARVITSIIVSLASNKYGRRAPSIISGVGMTICMGALATYLCLVKPEVNLIPSNGWLPVTALIVYILTSTVGFLTLPWAMIGEVFPSNVRGLASGITTCVAYVFSFIAIKIYPSMLHSLGTDGVFFFYGSISLAGTIFVIFLLPETKGKTLLEIEEYFMSKKESNKPNELIKNGSGDQDRERILDSLEKPIIIVPSNPVHVAINSQPS